jgi:hypothetical protein
MSAMKRFFDITAVGVALMLAIASPSLAKPTKNAQPVDNSPVVTPDTTPPPVGTAAPTGAVQVSTPGSAPAAATSYTIPLGGAQAQPQAQVHAAGPTPAAVPVPQGPPEPPVMLRAEQCLRANVERVARAEASPKLATDLLLADVCSDEVDAGSLYLRNVEALAHFNPESERGRAGLSTPHVDLETGQIVSPPNVDVSSALAADAAGRGGGAQIAANLRKYAAELVLNEKLRLASPAARPPTPAKKSH